MLAARNKVQQVKQSVDILVNIALDQVEAATNSSETNEDEEEELMEDCLPHPNKTRPRFSPSMMACCLLFDWLLLTKIIGPLDIKGLASGLRTPAFDISVSISWIQDL